MSAFNAKNLEYNRQEPSFLRKLKAEHGGDRSNVQFARPKKDRLKTGHGDEDEPTIVDEHGHSLGKGEFEEMLKKEKEGAKEEKEGEHGQGEVNGSDERREDLQQESFREKQQVAEIGTSKRRKAVKVVADETATEKKERDNKWEKDEPKSKEAQKKPAARTTKKKTKKVKLSFDDTNDG